MIKLFHAMIPTNDMDAPTRALLTAVSEFQTAFTATHTSIHSRVLEGFNPSQTWAERRAMWDTCRMTEDQYRNLIHCIHRVADILNDQYIHAPAVDYRRRFTMSIFNNTIADILIQSIYDNHVFTRDPLVRRLLEEWETEVILPLFRHLDSTHNLDILNNEPLIGPNACMENWALFKGDPKRGMFQTVGSAMAKGFYRSLCFVIECNDPYVRIPSSLLGNLVGWGLHATDPDHREAMMDLMTALLVNEQYRPSTGVYETIAGYVPGQIKRAKVDLVRDCHIGVMPDYRDEQPPADLTWQNDLLTAARVVLDQKVPLGTDLESEVATETATATTDPNTIN